jgi:glycerophosphoryl diester phosphodiesterase
VAALAFAALLAGAAPAGAFDLEGHRGARGLLPENTLPAFAKALSIGVSTIELDIGITSDGALAISHNRRLNPDITRGPDGQWLTEEGPTIRSLTLAELEKYDIGGIKPGTRYAKTFAHQLPVPGTHMPTLHDVVALVRKSGNTTVRFDIETKLSPVAPEEAADPETFVRSILAALRAEKIVERTTIESFDWRTLRLFQRLAPEIPTAYLTIQRGGSDNVWRGRPDRSPWLAGFSIADYGESVPRTVKAASGRIWSTYYRDLTDEDLAVAKSLGLKTLVWTVDKPDEMRLLIDRGVDGIITDYPDILRKVMAEKGMKLPPATPVMP